MIAQLAHSIFYVVYDANALRSHEHGAFLEVHFGNHIGYLQKRTLACYLLR